MTPFEIAKWLRDERGFSVIPLDHPGAPVAADAKQVGKVPIVAWAPYQKVHASDDLLLAWFGQTQPRNIAIVTGAVSGVVVVDCDSPDAEAFATTQLPPTPMATRTGSGGLHLMFRHPGGGEVRNRARLRTADAVLKLDVRADGGYVVAPSSLHASGRFYEKVGTWPRVDALPVFDPLWLQPEPTPVAVRPLSPARWMSHDDDMGTRLVRGRAYLDAMGGAIEGEGGDQHTYRGACFLVNDLDLCESDAFELLRAWSQSSCSPPWSAEELSKKLKHARRYGRHPVGAALTDSPRVQTVKVQVR